jgi:hypothetical protein
MYIIGTIPRQFLGKRQFVKTIFLVVESQKIAFLYRNKLITKLIN